jgi:hypothetical protein
VAPWVGLQRSRGGLLWPNHGAAARLGSAVSRDHDVWSTTALEDHGPTAVASVDARDRPLPSATTEGRTAPARSCAVGSRMLCRRRPRRRPVARIRRRGTALGTGAISLNSGGYTSGHRLKQAEPSAATPQTTSACAGSAEGRCRRVGAVCLHPLLGHAGGGMLRARVDHARGQVDTESGVLDAVDGCRVVPGGQAPTRSPRPGS